MNGLAKFTILALIATNCCLENSTDPGPRSGAKEPIISVPSLVAPSYASFETDPPLLGGAGKIAFLPVPSWGVGSTATVVSAPSFQLPLFPTSGAYVIVGKTTTYPSEALFKPAVFYTNNADVPKVAITSSLQFATPSQGVVFKSPNGGRLNLTITRLLEVDEVGQGVRVNPKILGETTWIAPAINSATGRDYYLVTGTSNGQPIIPFVQGVYDPFLDYDH